MAAGNEQFTSSRPVRGSGANSATSITGNSEECWTQRRYRHELSKALRDGNPK